LPPRFLSTPLMDELFFPLSESFPFEGTGLAVPFCTFFAPFSREKRALKAIIVGILLFSSETFSFPSPLSGVFSQALFYWRHTFAEIVLQAMFNTFLLPFPHARSLSFLPLGVASAVTP